VIDSTEHLAIVKGKILKNKNTFVRMHSLNLISDLLDNNERDLQKSIEIISKNNSGIIVIVRNPEKEMKKKDSTKNNNKNKILKDYGVGAQILIDLGVKKITLLARSSKNIVGIDGFGLEINGTKKI
tara:strand:- start:90 stop:470 length:381 start_codon:yes stop_codon:yes gene_type:complete